MASKEIKNADQEFDAVISTIRSLKEEVARLEKAQVENFSLTVKNDLKKARAAITRNKNKAEKLAKAIKCAVANEALAQDAQDSSQSLKKRVFSDAGEETDQRQAKRKVQYSDLERSSSLSPVPDDFITTPLDDANDLADTHKNNEEDTNGANGANNGANNDLADTPDAHKNNEEDTNGANNGANTDLANARKNSEEDTNGANGDSNNGATEDKMIDDDGNGNNGPNSVGVEGGQNMEGPVVAGT
ncbi:hypothetical protein H0H93_009904 [Arthromyces matolae]|nr:hypothetical protein H0H93_009904 [Arthromyces matolae]